jgi:hypothetical protein
MNQMIRNTAKHRSGVTIGRAVFARISAIEAVCLTAEMVHLLDQFERGKLSSEERHQLIAAKYGLTRHNRVL